ncbi:MAG TPA: diacylglycerol kinase family protein [Stackebrandtia sp.]|uniref:diacylglycerol/lipid kinase family protein n=1 Tax=Stackebrandtia sp. TaxID=2023065 RepID=UPI002D5FD48C|nr:diacylglycerol kinase family protein [Stackebrandtia sp.]HZE41009.1 diacylglycerol kinase family protein [Stackebrandtia sp.]
MRTFTALINPISGGGRAEELWRPISEALAAASAPVTEVRTRGREHAVATARLAAERGDVVVAVGGDGLVRDAAGGAGVHGGTVAIVPGGRGNDLAACLGVPTAPADVARTLLDGPARGLDLLDVNGILVPGNVYIGIDSVATRIINQYRFVPARLLYRLAPVRAIATWRAANYTLIVDGRARHARAHTVIVANSGHYGHGLNIVPPAVPDDGLAHVMVVGDGPRSAIVRFMSAARSGRHVDRPEVDIGTATTVTVDADRPIPVCADGDEVATLPSTITLRRHAIHVIAARSA